MDVLEREGVGQTDAGDRWLTQCAHPVISVKDVADSTDTGSSSDVMQQSHRVGGVRVEAVGMFGNPSGVFCHRTAVFDPWTRIFLISGL